MPPYGQRLFGMLAKVESVYGTDPTPAAGADGIRLLEAFEPQIEHVFANRREDAASGTLGRAAPGPMRGRIITFGGVAEIKGSRATTAYSASNLPPIHPLLVATGYSAAVVTTGGSESVTYTPADGSHSSCTVWYYWGGKLYKAVGCRGTGRLVLTPGNQGRYEFTMQGLLSTTPTETALAGITSYGAAIAPTFVAGSLGLTPSGGSLWTPDRFEEFSYDLGSAVQRNDSGNAADGIGGFDVSDLLPVVNLRALLVAIADFDPYTLARTPTSVAVVTTLGSVQYNRVDVNAPVAWLRDPGHAHRNRFAGVDLAFDPSMDIGETRPTLVFD
jgi:hypothetical protein